jgi:hypothetical protein
MTIQLRGSGINTNGSGGAITVTLSAAPQAGDLIVLVHKQDPSGGGGTAGTITPPFSPGSAYGAIDDANYNYLTVWTKIASGSEGTSAAFSAAGNPISDAVAGVLVYYSDSGGTLSLDGTLQTVNDTSSGTTWSYPAVTTSQANCMVVIGAAGCSNGPFAAATNFSGWGSFTERIDQSISSSYSGLGMADQLVATASTVSAGTVTSALSDVSVGFGFSIKETGSSGISGTLSQTLGNVTSSAAGAVALKGTLSSTLASATTSAAGALANKGALSSTLGNVTLSAAGTIGGTNTGALSVTLANATITCNVSPLPPTGWSLVNVATPNATAAYRITASPDIASGDQIAYDSNGGLVTVFDDATFSVDPSISSFDVMVWSTGEGWGAQAAQDVPQIGELTSTLANVTLTSAGTVRISAASSTTLAALTVSATGTAALAGTSSGTLANVTLSSAAALALKGAASPTLADVSISATGVLTAPGTGIVIVTLADATLSAAGTVAIDADASVTLADVTSSAAGTISLAGALSATLGDVTLEATGQNADPISADLDVTLDDVTLQAEGGSRKGGRRKRVRDGLREAMLMSTKGRAAVTLDAVSFSATLELRAPIEEEAPPLPAIVMASDMVLADVSCRCRGEGAALVDGLKRSTVPNGLLLKRLANIERMLANQKAAT